MSIMGRLVIGSSVVMCIIGLFLVMTAFLVSGPPGSSVPPAQVVESTTSPINPPRDHTGKRVSGGRLLSGLLLIAVGGAGLLFSYAMVGLADLANH
jgi:hypothetical protein